MPTFSVSQSIDVEFEVYCGTCGAGLCSQSDTSEGRRGLRVDVEVCGVCQDRARYEGYNDGYSDGKGEE